MPPPPLSYFQVKETQNTNPRFLRSTLNIIPTSKSLLNSTSLYFDIHLTPFASLPSYDTQVPKVEINDDTIFRCNQCRAYINNKYSITYYNYSKKITCNLCGYEEIIKQGEKGVKPEYLTEDINNIPELIIPTVDFVAPTKYQREDFKFKPHYLFMIDISFSSYELGLPNYIINSIQMNIDNCHNKENSFIGIALYNSNKIFFFTLEKGELQVKIMSDLNDPFCPISTSYLFLNVSIQKDIIDALFEKINIFISDLNANNEIKTQTTPTGSAIKAGISALSDTGGRVIVFTPMNCGNGFGQCDQVKGENIFLPKHDQFIKLAEIANEKSIVVDQFIFTNATYDLSTIAPISTLTGGRVNYYPFSKDNVILSSYYEKMHYDIEKILCKENYYDLVFTVRSTLGVECKEILGGFGKKVPGPFRIAGWDGDSGLSFNMHLADSLSPNQQIHFQFVCLYTNNFGERFIRLFNSTFAAGDTVGKVFSGVDCETMTKALLMRQIEITYKMGLIEMRKNFNDFIVNSLIAYRKAEKKEISIEQLVFPQTLKNLPLYINSFIKSGVIGGFINSVQNNESIWLFIKILRETIGSTIKFLYPRLYRIDDIQSDQIHKFQVENSEIIENVGCMNEKYNMIQKPYILPLSKDSIDFDCAYLLDDGLYITLFIFDHIKPTFYEDVFGVSTWKEAKENFQSLSEDNQSDLNIRILNIINQLRQDNVDNSYQPIRLMFYEDSGVYKQYTERYLIEDTVGKDMNYNDYLYTLHMTIKGKLK